MPRSPRKGEPEVIDIFEEILSIENLENAFRRTQKGKSKYEKDAMKFALDETYNLMQLRDEIINGSYEFSGYITFTISHPKEREINAPYYRDKIVQLAINNILKDLYNPRFVYDTYACIDDRGTHSCVERVQCFMQKARWEYGDGAYIVKIDLKKFFYSIDRDILKTIFAKSVKDKRVLDLVYIIIDSADDIGPLGLPLGNVLSQLSANILLNTVDQYVKRNLGIRYYARYMDDMVIIAENKERAREVLELVRIKVETELKLQLNEKKSKIFPLAQGLNFVGFKIHPTHLLLRDSSKRTVKRKLSKMKELLLSGQLEIGTANQILGSLYGHIEIADSWSFTQYLLNRYDYLELVEVPVKIRKRRKGGKKKIDKAYVLKVNEEAIKNGRTETFASA